MLDFTSVALAVQCLSMLFCVYLISCNNTGFFIIFPTIFFIIHYSLPSSKVISNIIWEWWLLIGFSFFPCIVSRLFTLCIFSFWFLHGCKKTSWNCFFFGFYIQLFTLHLIVYIIIVFMQVTRNILQLPGLKDSTVRTFKKQLEELKKKEGPRNDHLAKSLKKKKDGSLYFLVWLTKWSRLF